MAARVEAAWPDAEGVVVVPDGHAAPTRRIEVLTAAHPTPDWRSLRAAERMLGAAAGLGPDDLLLMLLSGGGSALLAAPVDGLTLADKQAATRALLDGGAPIAAINAVRRRLSCIKGGHLARAAAPARVCNLIISDVPGDDPAQVASGPTLPPPPDPDLTPWLFRLPPAARRLVAHPRPAPTAAELPPIATTVVARADDALAAVAQSAGAAGVAVLNLGVVEGEARALARAHAALALAQRRRPLLIASGGETTAEVRGDGQGGRNTEYLLALLLALDGAAGVHALAADTDGIDGRGGHAGAIGGPDTLARLRAAEVDPLACLEASDSRRPFDVLGDLLVTGSTRTNVGDLRLILAVG
jgi:hydroxypyruvate reductase